MSRPGECETVVRVVCTGLPGTSFESWTAVRLGILRGADVIHDVPGDGERAVFDVPLRVRSRAKTGEPNFLGPFAHGTPAARFLYLSWGERRAGGGSKASWDGFRRAKIHLRPITWDAIDASIETGQPIVASLHMTDARGGPLCASVPDQHIQWRFPAPDVEAPGGNVGPTIETERLLLVPFEPRDLDALFALFTDPAVRRFLLDGGIVEREWVVEEIAASTTRFATDGCGLWTIRRRASPGIVGMTGFRPFFEPPELQLIYGLLPEHWGCGLATEASGAVVRHALDVLGLDEIIAAADTPNHASFRVMERLGMRAGRTTARGEHGTRYYRIGPPERVRAPR